MVDTVRLLVGAEPTEDQLHDFWTRHQTAKPGAEPQVKYHYNPEPEAGILPRYTYRPKSHAGAPQISLELSLPKLVSGNNWELLTDLGPAIRMLDDILDWDPAIPPMPPVASTALSRVDLCCHYEVGEDLPHYIDALSRLDYPRRTTIRFNAETVEFRANSIKSKFYDKHTETKGACPPGILRHEITYHRARSIKTAFNTRTSVLLGQITLPEVTRILTSDLQRLGIDARPFASHTVSATRLCGRYGTTVGPRLYGVLCIYQEMGRDEAADRLGITRNALTRLLSQVRDAGIATAITDTAHELPPLQVTFPEPPTTCIQTPGVTQGSLVSEEAPDQ